jgi:hypothetical protein
MNRFHVDSLIGLSDFAVVKEAVVKEVVQP